MAFAHLKAQDFFAQARFQLEQDGEFSGERIDSCIRSGFQRDSGLYYRALLQLKAGHNKLALNDIARLQHDYSDFKNSDYLQALYYFNTQDYGRSSKLLNGIIKRDPKNIKALYNRALLAATLDDYKAAIEDLSTCIVLNPHSALYCYSRAYWYEHSGKLNEAIADYEKALELNTKLFDAYFGMANCYHQLKNNESACKAIERAEQAGSQIAFDAKQIYCR